MVLLSDHSDPIGAHLSPLLPCAASSLPESPSLGSPPPPPPPCGGGAACEPPPARAAAFAETVVSPPLPLSSLPCPPPPAPPPVSRQSHTVSGLLALIASTVTAGRRGSLCVFGRRTDVKSTSTCANRLRTQVAHRGSPSSTVQATAPAVTTACPTAAPNAAILSTTTPVALPSQVTGAPSTTTTSETLLPPSGESPAASLAKTTTTAFPIHAPAAAIKQAKSVATARQTIVVTSATTTSSVAAPVTATSLAAGTAAGTAVALAATASTPVAEPIAPETPPVAAAVVQGDTTAAVAANALATNAVAERVSFAHMRHADAGRQQQAVSPANDRPSPPLPPPAAPPAATVVVFRARRDASLTSDAVTGYSQASPNSSGGGSNDNSNHCSGDNNDDEDDNDDVDDEVVAADYNEDDDDDEDNDDDYDAADGSGGVADKSSVNHAVAAAAAIASSVGAEGRVSAAPAAAATGGRSAESLESGSTRASDGACWDTTTSTAAAGGRGGGGSSSGEAQSSSQRRRLMRRKFSGTIRRVCSQVTGRMAGQSRDDSGDQAAAAAGSSGGGEMGSQPGKAPSPPPTRIRDLKQVIPLQAPKDENDHTEPVQLLGEDCVLLRKVSSTGKVTVYMPKIEYEDYGSATEPVEGVVVFDRSKLEPGEKVYVALVGRFRYGREEDEILGMSYCREIYMGYARVCSNRKDSPLSAQASCESRSVDAGDAPPLPPPLRPSSAGGASSSSSSSSSPGDARGSGNRQPSLDAQRSLVGEPPATAAATAARSDCRSADAAGDDGGGYPPIVLSEFHRTTLPRLPADALPFRFEFPPDAPVTVCMQRTTPDAGDTCGVRYYVRCYSSLGRGSELTTVSLLNFPVKKVQYMSLVYSPLENKEDNIKPKGTINKEFPLSGGSLRLEATLNKPVYEHGEEIRVHVRLSNTSHKTVKHVKVSVLQVADISLFSTGKWKVCVATTNNRNDCPISSGNSIEQDVVLVPKIGDNKHKYGVFVQSRHGTEPDCLASSTV